MTTPSHIRMLISSLNTAMAFHWCFAIISTACCISAQLNYHNSSALRNSTRRLGLGVTGVSQRIVNQPRSAGSLTAAVNARTSLYVQGGQTTTLYFDVTNNNNWNTLVQFYCNTDSSTVQYIQPRETWIAGQTTVLVRVVIRVGTTAAVTSETITFTAVTYSTAGDEPSSVKAYLYTGQQVNDNSSPDMSYTITGTCSGATTPSTCAGSVWSLQATIQDSQSGLLSVVSVPSGFEWTSDFTAGTKDKMSGRYSASCCLSQVDLIATDLNGNQYRTTVDINSIWLSSGAIAAIVLASILLLLLIILICCGVGYCIRRRRNMNTFTMHT